MRYCSFFSSADRSRSKCRRAVGHILTLSFFWAMLALRIAGAAVCTKQIPESLDRRRIWNRYEKKWVDDRVITDDYKAAWLAVTAIIAITGFHFIISYEHGLKTLVAVTLAAIFVPAMFYSSYANFLYLDDSLWQQIITVSILMVVYLGVVLCLAFAKVRKNGYEYIEKRKLTKTRISWRIVSCIFWLGTLFHSMRLG
ncbi:hypothetical protein BCR34DRAFT_600058 [Clohesyomyces aquaticus]|uniref:Uncharacterized protein n=1 Tax=Clohesyomyces aquaticus TaxID=1231657 RepID=A0A1Y1ZSU0_9PLEO|nr:hypothetical protein BCR34DRAFT_600058 [Clohesyomyces aquaticus]